MYVASLDILHTRAKTVINSKFMSTPIIGQVASLFGAISVQDDGGTFDYIYDKLNHMENFYLFISPKGSIAPAKWKTGYYNLAKKLNAELVVVGLDYVKRELVIGDYFYVGDMTFEETTKRLQGDMAHIHPLNTEYLEYESPHMYSLEDPNSFGDLGDLAFLIIVVVIVIVAVALIVLANR